jgi:hypothetical protein
MFDDDWHLIALDGCLFYKKTGCKTCLGTYYNQSFTAK